MIDPYLFHRDFKKLIVSFIIRWGCSSMGTRNRILSKSVLLSHDVILYDSLWD